MTTARLAPTLLVLALLAPAARADDAPKPPDGLEPIGGRWFVKKGEKPAYFFRDGDRYVDLFSYHMSDSNKDGVENIRLRHDERSLLVDSQGYPNHPTALFPNRSNPNRIEVQNFRFRLPLEPKLAGRITRVPMGPIGMALNGVVFFNPFEAGGMNAVAGYSEVWLDSCCGHPQQTGVYHYHKYPTCVKTPFADDGKGHSPVVGFAFDGFPLHGPYESDGVMAKDLTGDRALDVCNGHADASRGYHYHVTPGRFPYLIGGYAGVPEPANNPGLRRAGEGAIVDNAEGESRQGTGVVSVTPGTIHRGKKASVRITLNPETVPAGKPSWVQVGPYEATKIERDGDVLVAELDVPEDASLGVLLDAHVEFEPANGRGRTAVIKRNDALRVVE